MASTLLKRTNKKYLEILKLIDQKFGFSEAMVDEDFYSWSSKKNPMVSFSVHQGSIRTEETIWTEDLEKFVEDEK